MCISMFCIFHACEESTPKHPRFNRTLVSNIYVGKSLYIDLVFK
uniref:Uncharacterized protein n=1 Tax=Rhizophora mucronata TaxID=61149 RepID=A0A2P2IV49_RHIMU